jgi:hypothetical protein
MAKVFVDFQNSRSVQVSQIWLSLSPCTGCYSEFTMSKTILSLFLLPHFLIFVLILFFLRYQEGNLIVIYDLPFFAQCSKSIKIFHEIFWTHVSCIENVDFCSLSPLSCYLLVDLSIVLHLFLSWHFSFKNNQFLPTVCIQGLLGSASNSHVRF